MRIPISPYQRQIEPTAPSAAPMARVVPLTGLRDLGEAVGNFAEQGVRRQAIEEEKRQREAEQREIEQEKARVHTTESQARLDWTASEIERRKTWDPATSTPYVPGVLKDFDGYLDKSLAAARTPREREMLRARLESLRTTIGQNAMVFEAGARSGFIKRSLSESLDRRASTAAMDPAQFPDLLAQQAADINGNELLSAEDRREMLGQARENIGWAAAQTMADRDPRGFLSMVGAGAQKIGKNGKPVPLDAQETADRVSKHPILSQLPPKLLRQVTDRAAVAVSHMDAQAAAEAERRARRAEIAASKREREANTAYTILSDWARDGKLPDPVASKPLLQAIAGTPYAAAYAERAQATAANAAAAVLPLAEQRARLDVLKAKRNADGTSSGLEHEIDASEKILRAAESDYRADPLRAGAERGVIPAIAPLDTTNIDSMIKSIGPRVEQAGIVATRTGTQVSPLTADEAVQMKAELDALPPPQRSAKVAALAGSIGPQAAQGLAAQLDDKDRALALAFASGSTATSRGRYVSELILRGASAQKDGTSTKNEKQAAVKVPQWKAAITTQLEGVYPAQTLTDRTREAALLIAHGFASEQGGELSGRDLERAVEFAIGGKLADVNGRKIPLPAGMDQDALEQRLQSVTPAEIASQAGGDTVRAAGLAVPVDQFVKSLPGAQLMYAGPGRYMVIVQGRPVTSEKGSPIFVGLR